METYEGRLASFKLHPSKRKVNEAYSATTAWPHHPTRFSVTPSTLAHAGFYHDPTESANDNVTCVYCNKGLEGWEDGDDALDEHLKRVIDKDNGGKCPWATMMGLKRDYDLFGPNELDGGKHDPLAKHLITARKQTFGEWWKFDGKKGWKPTSDRLAQAGFYSTPLVDSPDTCACPYCDVVLDGWSKNDDPEEEHRSRQPNCFFFVAQASSSKGTAKISNKNNLKASTSSSTRRKTTAAAAARDEVEESAMEEEEEAVESQSTKPNRLTASTSRQKKKVPKKRSATETSIAEEAESKHTEVKQEPTADDTLQDVEIAEEKKKLTKSTAKSRKSKAASATTTKKTTSKTAKGKSKASTAEAVDEVITLETESEADALEPPPPSKPAPKTRKRTTRANTEEVHHAIPPPSPEPEKPKKTARGAASKTRSKKALPDQDVEESAVESVVAPSDNGLTTENETEASEAEPLSGSKRSTRSNLTKSTSSAETRATRANVKKVTKPTDQVDMDVMSVSEASEHEITVAESSKAPSKRASSVKSAKSTRSTASARKGAHIQPVESQESTMSQSTSTSITDASHLSRSTSIAENIQEVEAPPPVQPGKKAAPPSKATKSKTSKNSALAKSTTRSTRSGHASDSAAAHSESEASYGTQSEDETIEEMAAEITHTEPSRMDMMDASTPKAVSKASVKQTQTKIAAPPSKEDTTRIEDEVMQVQEAVASDVKAAGPSVSTEVPLQQVPVQPALAYDGAPASASPALHSNRLVKALPARKSKGESPIVSIPAKGSIFSEASNRSKPKSSTSSVSSAPPSSSMPMPSRAQFTRGQSALDALLAGPIPTFDSPEKQMNPPQQPVTKPASTVSATPLAPTSPASKQASHKPAVVLDEKATVKEWIAILRQQEMERFDSESKKLLVEFDKQTQRKREELSALLRQR